MKAQRLFVAASLFLAACAAGPILDRQALLERQDWWDNRDWDWYVEKIPFFESPDPDIDATYYYRWEVLTKHLTYGSPETGYTFTEFIDRPFWSGTYGAISCPLGHQFYEVRWLRDRQVIEDFARYWFETPGAEPRSYSNWYGDAMWATYMVLGDRSFIETLLPHMETQYQGWIDEHWDPDHGMFRWDGMHDGMETNINSRQTVDEFMGAEGYRPTLNSYLYADALAISRSAALLEDPAKADVYARRAAELKGRVQAELWDPARNFFFHQFANDELNGIRAGSLTHQMGNHAGSGHGRELIGYVPWQFNLPDPGYEAAWQYLMDPEYFAAPYGPTTVEQGDPLFHVSPRCCEWSGNAWPYATTQTLVALANLLNNYGQTFVDRNDYVSLLRTYAASHRLDGRPYIAEAADPYTGSWDGHNTFYHSEHYLHSAYVDLVITGLAGLRPRADSVLEVNPLIPESWDYFALENVSYRGRNVSIVWDRNGSRYGRGSGLTLIVDGSTVANAPDVRRMTVPIGDARVSAPERSVNLAANNGGRYFPVASASHSAPTAPPHYAVDGNYWYHDSPPNRWTTAGSGNASDWFAVDFGARRRIDRVKLYFLGEGGGVGPPAEYDVEIWDGETWIRLPGQRRAPATPSGRRANVVSFMPVETSKVRAILTHRPGWTTGLSEFEVWGDAASQQVDATSSVLNLAFNANERDYPRVLASFSATGGEVGLPNVTDNRIEFTRYSGNRWTAAGSPNANDWLEVAFREPRSVRAADVYFWADEERGLMAPAEYRVEFYDGAAWVAAEVETRTPDRPTGSALNRITFAPFQTDRVRLVMVHEGSARTAVTELLVWERLP